MRYKIPQRLMKCSKESCTRQARCKGLCSSCYTMWKYYNNSDFKKLCDKANREHTARYRNTQKNRYRVFKAGVKNRGKYDLSLTYEEWADIALKPCHYCSDFFVERESTGSNLDRIDNSQGYFKENVVSCCKFCNYIKNKLLTKEETEKVIALVIQLRSDKKKEISFE